METKDIKQMTKEERLNHLIMLVKSYESLLIYDIYSENKFGEEMWKKEFRIACSILENMLKMRGMNLGPLFFIR